MKSLEFELKPEIGGNLSLVAGLERSTHYWKLSKLNNSLQKEIVRFIHFHTFLHRMNHATEISQKMDTNFHRDEAANLFQKCKSLEEDKWTVAYCGPLLSIKERKNPQDQYRKSTSIRHFEQCNQQLSNLIGQKCDGSIKILLDVRNQQHAVKMHPDNKLPWAFP